MKVKFEDEKYTAIRIKLLEDYDEYREYVLEKVKQYEMKIIETIGKLGLTLRSITVSWNNYEFNVEVYCCDENLKFNNEIQVNEIFKDELKNKLPRFLLKRIWIHLGWCENA